MGDEQLARMVLEVAAKFLVEKVPLQNRVVHNLEAQLEVFVLALPKAFELTSLLNIIHLR
jgi:hypothetical protein